MATAPSITNFGAFTPVPARIAPSDTPAAALEPPTKTGVAAPMGCELLVRNIVPVGTATARDKLQEAVDAIRHEATSAHGPGALVPLVAHFAGKTDNGQHLYHSAVLRMPADLAAQSAGPRQDLVEAWIAPLRSAHPEWDVLPVPLSHGRDKRCWLSVIDAADPTVLLSEAKAELTKLGYTLVTAYKTNFKNSVFFVFQQTQHVEEVLKTTIRVKSCKEPLKFQRSFQIDPLHVFEIAISGINEYDASIISTLRSVCEHVYRDPGHPKDASLIVDYRVVGDYFLVTFRDWATTARVLQDAEKWQSYVADQFPALGRPRLLFAVNDMPRERPITAKMGNLASGAQAYADDRFAEVFRRMDAMQQENAKRFQELNNSVSVMASGLAEVMRAASELKLSARAADRLADARDIVGTLSSSLLRMQVDLSLADSDEDKARIRSDIADVKARMAIAYRELDDAKSAKAGQSALITLPAAPSPAPSEPSTPRNNKHPRSSPDTPVSAPPRKATCVTRPPVVPINFAVTRPPNADLEAGLGDTPMQEVEPTA